jgi:hypothetical protein
MRAWIAAVVSMVLVLPVEAQTAPEAGSKKKNIPVQLHWSELAAVVTGQKVAIATPEGPRVEGRVIAVGPDALSLQIRSKGETRIPRTSITTLELRQMRKRGSIIGTTAGAVLGLAGAVAIDIGECGFLTNKCFPHKPVAAEVAVAIGLPVAGYFLGRWADRKNTRITILPDTP